MSARSRIFFIPLVLVALFAMPWLAGCDEDEVVNNNDLVPKICNLDLVQLNLTGEISVTYTIEKENGGHVVEVTYIQSDGTAEVIAKPDLPWTKTVTRPDGGDVGFEAEVEVTDRDSKITASVVGTSDGGATAIDASDSCQK